MTLLQKTAEYLSGGRYTVTCAESCTGGLLAAELTRLPGSSAWFEMSFVTYSNEAKQRLLGVSALSLASEGAVSETVAGEMARGALAAAGADFALAVSGIAGPGGGSVEKPVGTVCFGLAFNRATLTETVRFSGNRDEVRAQAVAFALAMLQRRLAADADMAD
ncbi:MAG: nicotinamide-nucleotide amidohydrolase family protein [Neisseria sp.]|nr:nicotinamide-nucleotide amidohydrolase family protein [Neisseria sp.]